MSIGRALCQVDYGTIACNGAVVRAGAVGSEDCGFTGTAPDSHATGRSVEVTRLCHVNRRAWKNRRRQQKRTVTVADIEVRMAAKGPRGRTSQAIHDAGGWQTDRERQQRLGQAIMGRANRPLQWKTPGTSVMRPRISCRYRDIAGGHRGRGAHFKPTRYLPGLRLGHAPGRRPGSMPGQWPRPHGLRAGRQIGLQRIRAVKNEPLGGRGMDVSTLGQDRHQGQGCTRILTGCLHQQFST